MLIRPNSHGNEVSIIYIKKQDFFRKVSYSEIGRKYINQEKNGIEWYSNIVFKNTNSFIRNYWEKGNYSRIDLKRINGKKIDYNSSLLKNKNALYQCLEHYNKVWPDENVVPCHGDLTLDNVLISNSQVTFFDWEHFSVNGELWGFDIAYLILSAAFLPYFSKGEIPPKDKLYP